MIKINYFSWMVLSSLWSGQNSYSAAAIHINPVHIHFSNQQRMETLTLTNSDDMPVTFHFRVVSWVQNTGEDVYEQSNDIMVMPSIVTIKPKSSQIVRLKLRADAHPHMETHYRVYMNEVPHRDANGMEDNKGLKFKLQVGLPVFVAPLKPVLPAKAHYVKLEKGTLKLYNDGHKHVHLDTVHFPHNKNKDEAANSQKVFKYILPQKDYVIETAYKPEKGEPVILHINGEPQQLYVQ